MALTEKDFIARLKGGPPDWSALDNCCLNYLRRLAVDAVDRAIGQKPIKKVVSLDVEKTLEQLAEWIKQDREEGTGGDGEASSAENILLQWIFSGVITQVQGMEGYVRFWNLGIQRELAAEYFRLNLVKPDLSALEPEAEDHRKKLVERADKHPDWQQVINFIFGQVMQNHRTARELLYFLFVPRDPGPTDDIEEFRISSQEKIAERREYLKRKSNISCSMRQYLEDCWKEWEIDIFGTEEAYNGGVEPTEEEKKSLMDLLSTKFSEDEIKDIIDDLGDEADDVLLGVEHHHLSFFAKETVTYFVRRDRFDELVRVVFKKRPKLKEPHSKPYSQLYRKYKK